MKKKILIMLVATSLLFGSLVLSVSANVLTPLKIVAGTQTKQLVRGIAEEIGVELTTRQFDNVVGHLNKRANDGDVKVIDWIDKSTVINPAPEPATKPNYKKYVLDPLLWVTGADLILEAVDAFNVGYENGTPVDVYEGVNEPFIASSSTPYQVQYKQQYDDVSLYVFAWSNASAFPYIKNGNQLHIDSPGDFRIYKKTSPTGDWSTISSNTTTLVNFKVATIQPDTMIESDKPKVVSKNVVADDYYDYSVNSPTIINNNVKTNYDNDTYYNQVKTDNSDDDSSNDIITYKMDLELPDDTSDSVTRSMDTLWNVEDSTITGGTFYVFDSGGGDVNIGGGGSGGSSNDDGIVINNNNNIDIDGLEAGEEVTVPKNFFTSLTYMGEKVGDMYDGVTHFFSKSVEGMKELTAGMAGFTIFLDDFFDWLPSEYKALLGTGFTLGVVAFFLRR